MFFRTSAYLYLHLLWLALVQSYVPSTHVMPRIHRVAVFSSIPTDIAGRAPQLTVIVPNRMELSSFRRKPNRNRVTWNEVISHVNEKMQWEVANEGSDPLSVNILFVDEISEHISVDSSVLVLLGLNEEHKSVVSSVVKRANAVVAFECGESVSWFERCGSFLPVGSQNPNNRFGDNKSKTKDSEMYSLLKELWNRHSSDDILFAFLLLIDQYGGTFVPSVQSVTSSDKTGLKEISCIMKNCFCPVVDCMTTEACRKALDCLNSCRGNDQVCSYRCITSYETPAFEKFAYCILQKNNCMGSSARIPKYPDPQPLTFFRGSRLTHEAAEDIFFGHLKPRLNATAGSEDAVPIIKEYPDKEDWSWKVICGQNPAYDHFGCQHQIFYRDAEKPRIVWYDPVFKVKTLGGKEVWRRRHYRVRRGRTPGTFFFSVLDNGVMSAEHWRIVDCADDLSWAVFYYGGAAAAAGTHYTGGLVVSRDGRWPADMENPESDAHVRIEAAWGKGGFKMWELYEVNNEDCGAECAAGAPPLGII